MGNQTKILVVVGMVLMLSCGYQQTDRESVPSSPKIPGFTDTGYLQTELRQKFDEAQKLEKDRPVRYELLADVYDEVLPLATELSRHQVNLSAKEIDRVLTGACQIIPIQLKKTPERAIPFCNYVIEYSQDTFSIIRAMFYLGEIYRKKGLKQNAIQWFESSFRLYQSFDPQARRNMYFIEAAQRIAELSGTTDTALEWYRQIALESPEVRNKIMLFENFSDYNREPLGLFFEERYAEILQRYPRSKLISLAQFYLAKQLNNANEYQKVIDLYPKEKFPMSSGEEEDWPTFKEGTPMGSIALMRIGWIYYTQGARERAIEAFQKVIERYPDITDAMGYRLSATAYMMLIDIYMGKRSEEETGSENQTDTPKVRSIFKEIIERLPNTRYLLPSDGYGEVHPEIYLCLAEMEPDIDKAVAYYRKVIHQYSTSLTGQSGTCAVITYGEKAIDDMGKHWGEKRDCPARS